MEQIYWVTFLSWLTASACLGFVYFWKFAQHPLAGFRGYLEELSKPWNLLVCGECLGTFLCSGLWLVVSLSDMVHLTLFKVLGWLSSLGIYYLSWNIASSSRRPLS